MATKDYTKTANTALKLIKKFGSACELVRNISTVGPLKPWEVATPSYSFDDCYGVKLPAGQKDVVFLPDGTSLSTTAKFLIDAINLNNTPTIGDQIKQNDIEYQIISVKPLQPADVDVVWTVYVNI